MKKIIVSMPVVALTTLLASGVFTVGCAPKQQNNDANWVSGAVKTNGMKYVAPTQEYLVPSNDKESVTVELTLDGDKIVDYNIQYFAHNPKSKNYQKAFADKIGAKIVGQSVKGLKVWVVNGASLTSKAFEESLTSIQTQVK